MNFYLDSFQFDRETFTFDFVSRKLVSRIYSSRFMGIHRGYERLGKIALNGNTFKPDGLYIYLHLYSCKTYI